MAERKKKDKLVKDKNIVIGHLTDTEGIISSIHHITSKDKTPRSQIKKIPGRYASDGGPMEYVEEGYMRNKLNSLYPIWSWVPAGQTPVQFLGAEWVIVSGSLVIEDNGVQRTFFSPGSARVQFKRGEAHTADNVIDIDKNVASANSFALKRAINRLTNIADDVYRKQVEIQDLSSEQLQHITDALNELGDEKISRQFLNRIEEGKIDQTNYKDAFDFLNNLIKKKESKKETTNE